MSAGARIPYARAIKIADGLFDRWGLDRATCHLVGSCRRGKVDVGDIELLCPAEPKNRDGLVGRIQATMDAEGMFAGTDAEAKIGRAVQGLKPGFLMCSLVVRPYGTEIAVQVFRYGPDNFGWSMVRTTGPGDFGKWFLATWKKRHGINPALPASVSNNLVDAAGKTIPTPTEEAAFNLCGVPWVAPEQRDAFVARMQGSKEQ